MDNTSNFHLSKWYLDCVSEDGTAFIGYSAELRWRTLSLHYSSILLRDNAGSIHSKTSLDRRTIPDHDGTKTKWISQPLTLDAEWMGTQSPVKRELYRDEGEIVWSCVSPAAQARINVQGFSPIEGLGYVEHLSLTVLPWNLPFKELRWGRFLSEKNSLVWIDWNGGIERSFTFLNGEEIQASSITDVHIKTENDVQLSLQQHAVIRNGPLISTALSSIPGLDKIFPAGILHAEESKWLSKGELRQNNSPAVNSWAIHELVRFL